MIRISNNRISDNNIWPPIIELTARDLSPNKVKGRDLTCSAIPVDGILKMKRLGMVGSFMLRLVDGLSEIVKNIG